MAGDRYRLITKTFTDTADEEYVSSKVFSKDEAAEQIGFWAQLHRAAGWNVRVILGMYAICMRNGKVRVISAHRNTPMGDNHNVSQ